MTVPEGLSRREKEGLGKLGKELWLYQVLYDDWKLREKQGPPTGGDERDLLGVPLSEIIRFLAPGAREESFLRTLNRYLRELEDCGAIRPAHVRTVREKRYCLADIPADSPAPMQNRSATANQHLSRLARTTRLIKLWLDGDVPERYDDHPLYGYFFWTLSDAEMWYFDNFEWLEKDLTARTIQRDIQAVWNVIKKGEE